MDDYISRQAAIDVLATMQGLCTSKTALVQNSKIWQQIKDLPSADVQPVVRCKDCKHWIPYDWMFSEVWKSQNIDDYTESEIGCTYCDMSMGAMDYCSRGERKDG